MEENNTDTNEIEQKTNQLNGLNTPENKEESKQTIMIS